MGATLAFLIWAAEPTPDGGTDPLLLALLGGGALTGLAAVIRGKSGAQLDVAGAAKVIIDELRTERDEERAERKHLEARNDELENTLAECRREHVSQTAELISHYEHQLELARRPRTPPPPES